VTFSTRITLDPAVKYILGQQGLNVCRTQWRKPLKKGLYEFRVGQSISAICKSANIQPPEGVRLDHKPLLRVFFTVDSGKIVLLLTGYDKGENPSLKRQKSEIAQARQLP
jgi:hypothetical protein